MVPQVSSARRPPWVPAASPPRGLDAALRLFDRYYLLVMIPVSALILFLNYHAQDMQGVVPSYEDFKRIILAGFDPKAGIYGTPTFPMWGYGWLLLLTENKTGLLLLQHALALGAVWVFFGVVERGRRLPEPAIRLLKLLLVVSLPWYAFHSLRWPYSVAVSLFLVSFVFFVEAMGAMESARKGLLVSGLLFGLMLNFRSDFIWMPPLFVCLACMATPDRRTALRRGSLWLATVYLMLIPWALYAKRATGHYLLTSTNAGHVLFIGLGNLPDNQWGIVDFDWDPVMHALIRERFGERKSSLVYESDQFLKREFLTRVLADPGEYGRKLAHNAWSVFVDGVYPGEFFERPECQPGCLGRAWALVEGLVSAPLSTVSQPPMETLRLFAQGLSRLTAASTVLLSFGLLPFVAVLAWRRRDLFLLLVCAGVLYQAAVNIGVYHMRSYTSNMHFFHLINLSVGAVGLWAAGWQRRGFIRATTWGRSGRCVDPPEDVVEAVRGIDRVDA